MKKKRFWPGIVFRVFLCFLVLGAGLGVMVMLVKQRKPPVEAEVRERAIHVEAQVARFEDTPVVIEGTGQVRARDVVSIAPEIAGRVVFVHPKLEMGEVIPKGELLFRIDPRDYEARLAEASASVNLWESTVERFQRQYAIDRERLKTLERNAELAKTEYERVTRLFENDNVGTRSGVDQAEQAWNTAQDQARQLSQQVSLYPMRIQEARSNLSSMEAMAGLAEVNLERTEVRAPFDARIREVELEAGQYVRPGVEVLTLANDTILEIPVGLDNDQARRWLRFDEPLNSVQSSKKAWFKDLKHVPVEITWVEGEEEQATWRGVLNRVEEFDAPTRTLRVVVRVEGEDAYSKHSNIPLVEGMFCRVRIPGRVAEDVVRLPAEAVQFPKPGTSARTVYVAEPQEGTGEHRLRTVPVEESHLEGPYVFISEGLDEGDLVITTRLVNPLENSLLEVEITGDTNTAS